MFWINEFLSFMLVFFISVFCGGCVFTPIEVPPEDEIPTETDTIETPAGNTPNMNTPAVDSADIAIQNAINGYITDFDVHLLEWTPASGGRPRVKVDITNISNQTYNWVVLHVAFLDNVTGEVVKTAGTGAISQVVPNQTNSIYVSGVDIHTVDAYIYNVQNNHFIYDEENGLMSTQ